LDDSTRKGLLLQRVEYFLSKEGMDVLPLPSETAGWIPLQAIAGLSRITNVTEHMDGDAIDNIKDALAASKKVTFNEARTHVRSTDGVDLTTIILRDLPSSTPETEVKAIFGEFKDDLFLLVSEVSDNWFGSFTDSEKAQEALSYVQTQKFEGDDVKARLRVQTSRKGDARPFYSQTQASAVLDMVPGVSPYAAPKLFGDQTMMYSGVGPAYAEDDMYGMFPFQTSAVVDHIARDSAPEHVASFLKNAYGVDAVMVHVPTDWETGSTYGFAYVEFETEAEAKAVCKKSRTHTGTKGSVQVVMRRLWEKQQVAQGMPSRAGDPHASRPSDSKGRRRKGSLSADGAGKGKPKKEAKSSPKVKEGKAAPQTTGKTEAAEVNGSKKAPKGSKQNKKETVTAEVMSPACPADLEFPSPVKGAKAKVAAGKHDILSPACPAALDMPSPVKVSKKSAPATGTEQEFDLAALRAKAQNQALTDEEKKARGLLYDTSKATAVKDDSDDDDEDDDACDMADPFEDM